MSVTIAEKLAALDQQKSARAAARCLEEQMFREQAASLQHRQDLGRQVERRAGKIVRTLLNDVKAVWLDDSRPSSLDIASDKLQYSLS